MGDSSIESLDLSKITMKDPTAPASLDARSSVPSSSEPEESEEEPEIGRSIVVKGKEENTVSNRRVEGKRRAKKITIHHMHSSSSAVSEDSNQHPQVSHHFKPYEARDVLTIRRVGIELFDLRHPQVPQVLQVFLSNQPDVVRGTQLGDRFGEPNVKEIIPLSLLMRSRPLLKMLESMTTYHLISEEEQQFSVFRYPFKLFVILEKKIRERHKNLQRRYRRFPDEEKVDVVRKEIELEERLPHSVKAGADTIVHSKAAYQDEAIDEIDAHPLEPAALHDQKTAIAEATDNKQNTKSTNTAGEKLLLEHLELFVSFLDEDMGEMLDLYHRVEAGTLHSISFADLWYLFSLGQEIVGCDESEQIYRVTSYNHRVSKESDQFQDRRIFVLHGIYLDFDGHQYGPVMKTFMIPQFDGTRPVVELPIFPLICHPNKEKLRQESIKRGSEFLDFTHQRKGIHRTYTGPTMQTPRKEIDSPIIIDFGMARLQDLQIAPKLGLPNLHTVFDTADFQTRRCNCIVCYRSPFENFRKNFSGLEDDAKFLNENRELLVLRKDLGKDCDRSWIMLLPASVWAFVLQDREWAPLDIRLVKPPHFGRGFQDLFIPPRHQQLLESLGEGYKLRSTSASENTTQFDSVDAGSRQGTGLIVLLHGVPGVGKSSSAKAFADIARLPLYNIACGDLVTDDMEIEEGLRTLFQTSRAWNCVLVLEEADIFLAARNKSDLRRNTVASVLLRMLDNYTGIVFLTTNRVGAFDEALFSRINLSLYYPPLDHTQTMAIWTINLKIMSDLEDDDMENIMDFAELFWQGQRQKRRTWNGREIRNAVQTAAALAKTDSSSVSQSKPKLSVENLEAVARSSEEFENYLTEVHGGATQADLASMEMVRSDKYDPDPPEPRTETTTPESKKSRYDDLSDDSDDDNLDVKDTRRVRRE